jgi:hypothetical protein
MNPEEILTRQALTTPEATRITEEKQLLELGNALKEMLRKEILNASKN